MSIKRTVGIIGCGNIGTAIAVFIEKELSAKVSGTNLCDINTERVTALAGRIKNCVVAPDLDALVDMSDVVVEAAGPDIVRAALSAAVRKNKDVIVISAGGVLGNESLLKEAREAGIKVFLPSGAIAGIDGIKAAKIAGIDSVMITTRKPPASLAGAPYIQKNAIELDNIRTETVIFEGSALDAVKEFPKNINVSALLSLAGIGPERTKVRIVTSPEYTRNIHEIEVDGKAGKLFLRAENVPSPDNPKTSYLACLACMECVRSYFDTVRLGN
ncbi:MAG: aspartate dehydrogenase [Candidatus Omnitrophica bacterium]|nr:aspartate dehydrogenase [Candidatus Omnitrophota bacterium]MDD5488098.1 aspartate dehydrogenase [Candidatus Omnitrophota bacterium]